MNKELATRRGNCLCKIKHFKRFGLPLTERQVRILILDETYRLQSQYFRVYQIGDPATVQESYNKLCELLDEEITDNER